MDTSDPAGSSSAAGEGAASSAGAAAGDQGIPTPVVPADAPAEMKSWAERDRERKKELRALQEAERNELQVRCTRASRALRRALDCFSTARARPTGAI